MSLIIQTILIFVLFSAAYFGVHHIPGMDLRSLRLANDSAGWLYSEIGLIFGVFAAFTIQAQAKEWDELLRAIREEVNSLRRLLWLSYNLPPQKAQKVNISIFNYLDHIVHEGWKNIDCGHRSPQLEASIRLLQEDVFDLFKSNHSYAPTAEALIRSVFESREERMFYSAKRTPMLLKGTIYMGGLMMIILSYFIGVSNIWIDYIFTGSIALLIILIVLVIEDLEHPYRPGHWHITQDAYQSLLEEVRTSMK